MSSQKGLACADSHSSLLPDASRAAPVGGRLGERLRFCRYGVAPRFPPACPPPKARLSQAARSRESHEIAVEPRDCRAAARRRDGGPDRLRHRHRRRRRRRAARPFPQPGRRRARARPFPHAAEGADRGRSGDDRRRRSARSGGAGRRGRGGSRSPCRRPRTRRSPARTCRSQWSSRTSICSSSTNKRGSSSIRRPAGRPERWSMR